MIMRPEDGVWKIVHRHGPDRRLDKPNHSSAGGQGIDSVLVPLVLDPLRNRLACNTVADSWRRDQTQ